MNPLLVFGIVAISATLGALIGRHRPNAELKQYRLPNLDLLVERSGKGWSICLLQAAGKPGPVIASAPDLLPALIALDSALPLAKMAPEDARRILEGTGFHRSQP